jgi:hypothetical protein
MPAETYESLIKRLRAADVNGDLKDFSNEELVTNAKQFDPKSFGEVVTPGEAAMKSIMGRGGPAAMIPPPPAAAVAPIAGQDLERAGREASGSWLPNSWNDAISRAKYGLIDAPAEVARGVVGGALKTTGDLANLANEATGKIADWTGGDRNGPRVVGPALKSAGQWASGGDPSNPTLATQAGELAGSFVPAAIPGLAAVGAAQKAVGATTLLGRALTSGAAQGGIEGIKTYLTPMEERGKDQRGALAETGMQAIIGTLSDVVAGKYVDRRLLNSTIQAALGAIGANPGQRVEGAGIQWLLAALLHSKAPTAHPDAGAGAGTPGAAAATAAALTPTGGPAPATGHVGGAPAQPHPATLTDTVPKPVAFGMEGITPNVPKDIIPGVGTPRPAADIGAALGTTPPDVTPGKVPPLGRPLGPPIPETGPAPGAWPPPPDYGTGPVPGIETGTLPPPRGPLVGPEPAPGPTPGTTPAPLPADIMGGFETATPAPPRPAPDLMGGFFPGQGRPPVDQGGGPGTLTNDFYRDKDRPRPGQPVDIASFYQPPPRVGMLGSPADVGAVPSMEIGTGNLGQRGPAGSDTGYVPPGVPPGTTPAPPLPPNLREAPPAPPSPRPLPPSGLPTPDSPFGQAVPPSGWPPLAPRTGTGVPMSLRPTTPDLPYGAASPLPRPTGAEPKPFGPQPAPRVTGRDAMEPPPPLAPVTAPTPDVDIDSTLSPTQQQEMRDMMAQQEQSGGTERLVTNQPKATTPEGMIIEDIDRPQVDVDAAAKNAPVGGAERRRRLLAERTRAKFENPDYVPPTKTPSMIVGRGGQVKKKVDASADADVVQFDHGVYTDADGAPVIDLDVTRDPKTKSLMDELQALLGRLPRTPSPQGAKLKLAPGQRPSDRLGYHDPADPLGVNRGPGEPLLNPGETLDFTNDTLKGVWTQFKKRPGHTNTLYVNRDAMNMISSIFGGDIINNTTHGVNIKPSGREMIQERLWHRFYKMDGVSAEAQDGVMRLSEAVSKAWDAIGRDESLKIAVARKGKVFQGLRDTVYEEWAHGGQNKVTIDPKDVKAITSSPEYQAARKNLAKAYSESEAFDEVTAKAMANKDLRLSIRQNLTLVEMYRDAVERAGGTTAINEFTLMKPDTREVFQRGKSAAEVATAAEARESAALAAKESEATARLAAAGLSTAAERRAAAWPPPAPGDVGPAGVGRGGDQQLQPGATGGREGKATGGRSKRGVPAEPAGVVGDSGGAGPGRTPTGGTPGGAAVESPLRARKGEATEGELVTNRGRGGQGFSLGALENSDASPHSMGFLGSQYASEQARKLWDHLNTPTDANGRPIPRPSNSQWATDAEYNRVMGAAVAEREAAAKAGKESWAKRVFNMNALDKFVSRRVSTTRAVQTIQNRIAKATGETPLPGDKARVIFDDSTAANEEAEGRTRGVIRGIIDKHLKGLDGNDAQTKMEHAGIYAQALQERQVEINTQGKKEWKRLVDQEKAGAVTAKPSGETYAAIDKAADAGDVNARMMRNNHMAILGMTKYREGLATGAVGEHYKRPLKTLEDEITQGRKYHQPIVDDIQAYFRSMLDESVADGRLRPELRDTLVRMYPDYVPVGRIMDDINSNVEWGSSQPTGHLAQQRSVRILGGDSDAPIEDMWKSLVTKTFHNTKEARRNKVGQELDRISKEYQGWEGHIERVKPEDIKAGKYTGKNKLDETNSITFLENGEPVTLKVDPLIAAAARNLKPNQMGGLLEFARGFARVLRGTATGAANPLFQMGNLAMDIGTNVMNTGFSTLYKKPFSATLDVVKDTLGKHSADLAELRSHGGAFTSAEAYRDNPLPQIKWEVAKSREGAAAKAKAIGKYALTNKKAALSQSWAAVEDMAAKSELIGRLRVYTTVRDQALAKGMSRQQANIAGLDAARNQMANYRQSGSEMQNWNAVTPYLNAGIQNIASSVEAARTNPELFALRVASYVVMPTIATTIYNLSSKDRQEAYLDSQDHDKDDNLLVVRPGVVNEDGKRQMLKWVMPGQYSPLIRATRYAVEQAWRYAPDKFNEIAQQMGFDTKANDFTPQIGPEYDTKLLPSAGEAVMSQVNKVIPQVGKAYADIASGTHQFSGRPFVSKQLEKLPAKHQIDKDTSRLVTAAAQAAGGSPAAWQGRLTALGGQGIPLGLNVADQVLQGMGILEPGKAGGLSFTTGLENRFLAGRGGRLDAIDRDELRQQQDATYDELAGQLSQPQKDMLLENRTPIPPVNPQEGDTQEVLALRQKVKGVMYSAHLQSLLDDPDYATLDPKTRKEVIKERMDAASHWLSTQSSASGKLDPDERENYWQGVMAQVEAAYR